MHAMVRSFSGQDSSAFADLLIEHKAEVESAMRGIPGMVSYTIIRTADGVTTMTLCNDKTGTDASLTIAKDWLKEHASHLQISAPAITEGEVVVHLT
ncbi:MAG: hypothetical protein WCZ23_16300 [Rhodospirillaceae bacterium]